MLRIFQSLLIGVLLVAAAKVANAFSLLGPLDTQYQTALIGYNPINTDVGGPMNLGEEYRWNIRTIRYGYDESFLNYFGDAGVAAVEAAIGIINSLPSVSQMSSDLAEFPTDTRRINYQASALGILDLKSQTLGFLLEHLGLASPERYVWTLRNRRIVTAGGVTTTNYLVIKRNFDPILGGSTPAPSSYVNDVLYTYTVREFVNPTFADAVERTVDPLAVGFTAVASTSGFLFGGGLSPGDFFTGLTRDDVGGLRYIYRQSNIQRENLLVGTTGGSSSPWGPIGGTTNVAVNLALRPGVEKITYLRAAYDSLVGSFITITNTYTDVYVTNSAFVTQATRRTLIQPDVLFAAEDLGLTTGGTPVLSRRNVSFINNNNINGQVGLTGAGPGVIQPQSIISFSKLGPYFFNSTQFFLDEDNATPGFIWGSFDGTTNPPVIYPNYLSIQQLEQQILYGQ